MQSVLDFVCEVLQIFENCFNMQMERKLMLNGVSTHGLREIEFLFKYICLIFQLIKKYVCVYIYLIVVLDI